MTAAPVRPEWGIGSRVVEDVGERTGNGWEVWPDGLRAVLERVHRDYGPTSVAITENGATYPDPPVSDGTLRDPLRWSYLARHLAAVADARHAGVPVDAYFVWSLLDNYEWAEGYHHPFGIVHVDFTTQRRTIKESGRRYADLIGRTAG